MVEHPRDALDDRQAQSQPAGGARPGRLREAGAGPGAGAAPGGGQAGGGKAKDPHGRDFTLHPALVGPPWWAVRVCGALFHTQGGLVIDEHAQVCRADKTKLPNLFAAGGTARSTSGPSDWGYIPAAGLFTAVTQGRLAGEAAARLVSGRKRAAAE